MKSCLFIVNGLGMGNCTRCYAAIQRLQERGMQCHVLTSGNGVTYFSDKKEVASLHEMEAFFYSRRNGRVSGWMTLLSFPKLRELAKRKAARLEEVLDKVKPSIAVIDSEYSIAPVRRRGIPLVGLNNSDVIVSEYLDGTRRHPEIRSHFWMIEFPDYLFHRRVCDVVVSPSPVNRPTRHPKFRRVGLMLRREVMEILPKARTAEFRPPQECKSFVFMLSGSIFASSIPFSRIHSDYHIHVVGREGENLPNITFHGKVMNNIRFLKDADAFVVNGGFCAVSEAIALDKPSFVIPVAGHAEQAINAEMLCDLGCGYMTTESAVIDLIATKLTENRWSGLPRKAPSIDLNGAEEAADIICEFAGRA